jgi:hypothetical protein
VEDIIEATCCPSVAHPNLTYGYGSSTRIPKLLKWSCVDDSCTECGIEKNLKISDCPILSQCKDEIDVLEWCDIKRQGTTKSGKQNTQIELSKNTLPVDIVVTKLIAALEIARTHYAKYKWKDLVRKIDLTMSNADTTCVICTDFGATLDLFAAEKDNSSVNNHAVIDIFLVCYNWRIVKYKRKLSSGEEVDDETVICDCDKWIFLVDTLSKGKKIIT